MGYFAEQAKLEAALAPISGTLSITPSDAANLAKPVRGLMVGVGGNVSVIMADGSTGVLPGLKSGIQYMGAITRINATATTATGIIGLV